VARLEREPTTLAQRRPDRSQRRAQLVVVDQALEGVADHRGQVELAVPGRLGGHAGHPLNVGAPTRPIQHRPVRLQPDQPTRTPGLPRLAQHAARPAAHVQDGGGGHHQVVVEGVAGIPRWVPRV
jgi:hypothetical protein